LRKDFAQHLHAAMKIDAHGAVGEAGTRGDLRAGHALDEAQDERFAIGFRERADGVEDGVRLGGGVRRAATPGCRCDGFDGSGFFVKRDVVFRVAMKIGGAVAGDGGEPAGEFGRFAEGGEAREGLQEDVLDEVFGVVRRHARQQDAMDHAGVAGVKEAESVAVAVLRGANQGVIRGLGRMRHAEKTRRTKLRECGHEWSIESEAFSSSRRRQWGKC